MRTGALRAAAVALALLVSTPAGSAPPVPDRIWFAPGPGTLDFQRLFEHPEEWARARDVIRVFKFYQQHTEARRPEIVGPNYYDALVRVNAFRKLSELRINTALEIGSVKEFWCTPDRSGMDASIRATLDAVQAIQDAGGTLKYIAMDEPWVSGRARVCDGPALEPTADRVATYMSAVQSAHPAIRIGLIEAYPFSSAAAIETMIGLLRARGTLAGVPAHGRRLARAGRRRLCARHDAPAGVRQVTEHHLRHHHRRIQRRGRCAVRR